MYIYILTLVGIFFHAQLFSQKIQGQLNDANYQGVAYTKIGFWKQKKKVAEVVTEADGSFVMENISEGSYEVKIYTNPTRLYSSLFVPNDQLFVLQLNTPKDGAALVYTEIELSNFELWNIPIARSFQYPMVKGGYLSRQFGEEKHLGEDWNLAKGNGDLGSSIYSISSGMVIFCENLGGKWGKVVRILHNLGTRETPIFVESVYAHLQNMNVKQGQIVKKGQIIGTMGNADGKFQAHLHLEIRTQAGLPLGIGYGNDTEGFITPSHFLRNQKAFWENK
ncbi:MAG: M23 family metallopeptidase [Bacteroidia bacterium]